MSRACFFLGAFLLATTAAPAMVAPDLADAARRLEQFPALAGQGSESKRLQSFFELYWFIRMREFPDLATYVGYPDVDDRLPDRSPEMLALIHRLPHQELAALVSIDRSRLTPAEQVDYDLARRRFEMEIEGEQAEAYISPLQAGRRPAISNCSGTACGWLTAAPPSLDPPGQQVRNRELLYP